jgi:glycosyltransferase involved in cell wall biosynthesis
MTVERTRQPRLRVFVHLANGMDARRWNERWRSGSLIGVNEPYPYGYHHAGSEDVEISFSHDAVDEGPASKLLRLGIRAALGFDLLHAWRNREAILNSDVVWTHTESQHLSVLLLRRLRRRATARPPAVIAQSVWIFDSWPARGISPRHRLWHWLMRDADMLTVHSPHNAEVARGIFPSTPVRFVKFGIRSDDLSEPRLPQSGAGPLRVLSLGNDKHRDWRTLVRATARDPRFDVRIVSHTASGLWSRAGKNIHVLRVNSNAELEELFRWADVIVVPLMPNLHASGITAIEEGVIRGVPVICTHTGGLDAYFTDTEVEFTPPKDVAQLSLALQGVFEDPPRALQRAKAAQKRLIEHGLTSRDFARAHVDISLEITQRPTQRTDTLPIHSCPSDEKQRSLGHDRI